MHPVSTAPARSQIRLRSPTGRAIIGAAVLGSALAYMSEDMPPPSGRPRPPAGPHRQQPERPLIAALSTRMPDGPAQTQPVWCEPDGNDVLVNTTRERRKGRNLAADPRATVLVLDPDDGTRWVEVRGDVELVEDGAPDQFDRLTRRYTGTDTITAPSTRSTSGSTRCG